MTVKTTTKKENKDYGTETVYDLQSLKYLLYVPLQEKIADPWYETFHSLQKVPLCSSVNLCPSHKEGTTVLGFFLSYINFASSIT